MNISRPRIAGLALTVGVAAGAVLATTHQSAPSTQHVQRVDAPVATPAPTQAPVVTDVPTPVPTPVPTVVPVDVVPPTPDVIAAPPPQVQPSRGPVAQPLNSQQPNVPQTIGPGTGGLPPVGAKQTATPPPLPPRP